MRCFLLPECVHIRPAVLALAERAGWQAVNVPMDGEDPLVVVGILSGQEPSQEHWAAVTEGRQRILLLIATERLADRLIVLPEGPVILASLPEVPGDWTAIAEAIAQVHGGRRSRVVSWMEPDLVWTYRSDERRPSLSLESRDGITRVTGEGIILAYQALTREWTGVVTPGAKGRLLHLQPDGVPSRSWIHGTVRAHPLMPGDLLCLMVGSSPALEALPVAEARRALRAWLQHRDGGQGTAVAVEALG
jgi:hypothetical protein